MKPPKVLRFFTFSIVVLGLAIFAGCRNDAGNSGERIPVILDTDANNELDDQHAIAYMLQNQEVFDILGITVNTTRNGGYIEEHYREAMRILTLFNEQENIVVRRGADTTFAMIRENLGVPGFDGEEAVEFIIAQARKYRGKSEPLVLLPIGKLTNIALALEKEPGIADNIRIVWLGSNYPESGEYNLENDTSALNYLLEQDVRFEIATVSYGRNTGTSHILVTLPEIDSVMPGLGPQSHQSIEGRHGGTFDHFGDYAVSLFHHIDLYGDPPARSLFDLGAVAIVKNPGWAASRSIPAPFYGAGGWIDRPGNTREIILWEHFERDSIVHDLYHSLGK